MLPAERGGKAGTGGRCAGLSPSPALPSLWIWRHLPAAMRYRTAELRSLFDPRLRAVGPEHSIALRGAAPSTGSWEENAQGYALTSPSPRDILYSFPSDAFFTA